MNSTKKNIQKTSGTRKDVIKVAYSGLFCLNRNYKKYDFCMDLPLGLKIKPI